MKANQKQTNVKVNESANVANNVTATATATATATDATDATATAEKVVKNTEKYLKDNTKPTEVKRDVNGFKDGGTKIATATAVKFEKLGKFIAKFQAIEAKDGGKTVYIFETAEKVFVGYTSSELSDVFGLPKREYKSNVEQVSDTLAALRYFRASLLEVEEMGFATGVKLEIVDKWISDTEFCDKERAIFEKRFAANIPLFPHITEAVFKALPNVTEEDLTTAKKLGYRFSDTTDTDTDTDTDNK